MMNAVSEAKQTATKRSCLIVDDDYLIASYLSTLSREWDFHVCGIARTAEEAVECAVRDRPDTILMDVRLVGAQDGVDAAIEIHRHIDTRIIFITGSQESSTIHRIRMDDPYDILIKPIDPDRLREAMSGE